MANGYSSYTPISSNELTTYVTRTNLYTRGGEYTLPNGKDYIGFYHIHPEKGPMVGANHREEFHEILISSNDIKSPSISSIEFSTNDNFSYEEYSEKDLKLISPATNSLSEFRPSTDRVEFSIYNEQGLLDNIEYNYKDYNIPPEFNPLTGILSSLNLDPGVDLIKGGYTQGFYQIIYNFLRDKAASNPQTGYYISQISADRTELRLASNILDNDQIQESANAFIEELNASPFFEDFYLNFGNNNLITAIRLAFDEDNNPDQFSLIVKLYEALPTQFGLKDEVWLSLQTAEAVSFDVEFNPQVFSPPPLQNIKGPNFDILDKDIVNNSTVFKTTEELINTELTSSYNELQNILNKKGVKVSIDYEDYNEFIYFSSAQTRLENFYYKVKEIEDFQFEINTVKTNITGSTSESVAVSSSLKLLENKITDIISNLDEYENFLYYTSGSSKTWPKSNSTPPYTLFSTASAEVGAWYGSANELSPLGQLGSASLYDIDNTDRLVNSLPEYVKGNNVNQPFFKFMDMTGQHFDVFWTYTKAIGDRYDADNRLDYGVSKDIVADAIRSMGVTLYQNNFSSNDLPSSFLGINSSTSLLPPTGSELINTYITASSDITKLDDVNKETYKRIFHNLPFLLKKKGTISGLRALINSYGIPDTILRISEFGGKDIDNTNDWDYYQNQFSYAAFNSSSAASNSFISTSFALNTNWNSADNVPETIMFRFKPVVQFETNTTKSIVAHTRNGGDDVQLVLTYEGSGLASGSYSGSIPSSSYQFVSLSMALNGTLTGPAVNAPFYDGNWWGVQLTRVSQSTPDYTLRVASNIYDGGDGFKIGYTASKTDSITTAANNHYTASDEFFLTKDDKNANASGYRGMTGSFQELRFYNEALGEETFHDFVMNPYSIEGIDYSSSVENLVFRAPLGSDLNKNTGVLISTHPKVTGSLTTTSSFPSSNNNYEIGSAIKFPSNVGFVYQDQPSVGIKNRISEKVKIDTLITASGNTLTPYRTIQQRYAQSESYTRDINHVEVAFSPQNEINDNINSSFGYFNIGEYIGDPSITSESVTSYVNLDNIQDTYFKKYTSPYDWRDYIRLIKYFDNSLFKMLKDFVPSKTSLSTGVVIKQHILERNRQRPAYITNEEHNVYTSSINVSFSSSFITGGAGGVFNEFNYSGSGQEWITTTQTTDGPIHVTQSDQREFYNGELSGSEFRAVVQEVGPHPPTASDGTFFTGNELPQDVFNPLLNNVERSVTSSIYYKIEYNNNFITPDNMDLIQEGVALKASISDGLYSRRAWNTSRYLGSRASSQGFNKTFTD